MAEDKRIRKTRKLLRKALRDLLETKQLENITVKELCQNASTSRITFYTHYKDKYELLNDTYAEFLNNVFQKAIELNRLNNPENILNNFFLNVSRAFVHVFYDNYTFMTKINMQKDSYAKIAFEHRIKNSIEQIFEKLQETKKLLYSPDLCASLVCGGLTEFIYTSLLKNTEKSVLEEQVIFLSQMFLENLSS